MCASLGKEFQVNKLCFKYSKPNKFLRSQWRISQTKYICWRGVWALWHTVWTVWDIWFEIEESQNKRPGFKWLVYMNNQSYLILNVQSVLLFYVVICNWRVRKKATSSAEPGEIRVHEGSMTCLLKVLWLLTTVGFDVAILVTVLYWTLVFKELYLISIINRVINLAYVILDLFVSAAPVRLLHFIYPMIYVAVYMLFTIFYHLFCGTSIRSEPYIYRNLNWAKPETSSAIAICTILFGTPASHMLQYGLYRLKLLIFESAKCCSCCDYDEPNAIGQLLKDTKGHEEEVVPVYRK